MQKRTEKATYIYMTGLPDTDHDMLPDRYRKAFKGGFSTGHGFLREPNDIQSYARLPALPYSRIRMTSTEVRAYLTLTTVWPTA